MSGDTGEFTNVDDEKPLTLGELKGRIKKWSGVLKEAGALVAVPGPSSEPFKNVYKAIELAETVDFEVSALSNMRDVQESQNSLQFWVRFTKIHVLSSLAKWNELCDQLTTAQRDHLQCIELLEKMQSTEAVGLLASLSLEETANASPEEDEIQRGRERVNFMYIYELTRYAILCSERDDQDKALELLKKAESFYHDGGMEREPRSPKPHSILRMLDSLNPDSAKDMFTYVLFYLGQAYKIAEEKELAILYLHMVLRRQLEKGDYSSVTWASDCGRMASVLMAHAQAFQTATQMLIAATTVILQTPKEEQDKEPYKEAYADLGKMWGKLGVALLETSADRLKDLEEEERHRAKFKSRLHLSKYQKLSLELTSDESDDQVDTLLLIGTLKFPSLDIVEAEEREMKGRFVRDFEEARAAFLCAQRWMNETRKYYTLDEYASDYIDVTTDHAALFKHLAFFEGSIERRVKMHKRRVSILEELIAQLNPKVYADIFHFILRDLSETYENIYKLKVDECKDRGKSLRPKDKKLVQWLVEAVGAHKRNLKIFNFDIEDATRSFPAEYEKILMATVLAVGRILGSVCHDHPLHPDAVALGEESKQFYSYFLAYLDRRIELKKEFWVLYEGSEDMPELLDSQIRKIKHHQRMREVLQSEEAAANPPSS